MSAVIVGAGGGRGLGSGEGLVGGFGVVGLGELCQQQEQVVAGEAGRRNDTEDPKRQEVADLGKESVWAQAGRWAEVGSDA
ncbi:hypothetical protein [Streptomyces marincola]|uniref:hypothetical protein n=1 Tax=Streptomyces marincola TaxID=2878388 RepID=UPI001CF24F90|nr:hypothetical protein [Streptomyces marincola]UCM88940.1 hypothetical protein LC193_13845 [Streptomyces marincola]